VLGYGEVFTGNYGPVFFNGNFEISAPVKFVVNRDPVLSDFRSDAVAV
jgi:hypothetical protein